AGSWMEDRESALESLRAESKRQQVDIPAFRTSERYRRCVAAMMTAQRARMPVQNQACRTAPAHRFPAAGGAQKRRGVAASIDEQERLLAPGEPLGYRRSQLGAYSLDVVRRAVRHQAHFRQRFARGGAFAQAYPAITSADRLCVAF